MAAPQGVDGLEGGTVLVVEMCFSFVIREFVKRWISKHGDCLPDSRLSLAFWKEHAGGAAGCNGVLSQPGTIYISS